MYALVNYMDSCFFQTFNPSNDSEHILLKTSLRIIAQLAIKASLSEDSKMFSVDFFSCCIRRLLVLLSKIPKPSTVTIAKVYLNCLTLVVK